MVLGALLWLAIPLKIIITMLWISYIRHVGWVCCWFLSLLREFFSGSSGFPLSTRTNILNSSGNIGKEELPRGIAGDLPGRVDGRSTPNSWRSGKSSEKSTFGRGKQISMQRTSCIIYSHASRLSLLVSLQLQHKHFFLHEYYAFGTASRESICKVSGSSNH